MSQVYQLPSTEKLMMPPPGSDSGLKTGSASSDQYSDNWSETASEITMWSKASSYVPKEGFL